MLALSRYSYINARLRAKIGKLLDENFLRSLAHMQNIGDIYVKLSETDFGRVFKGSPEPPDAVAASYALGRYEAGLYREALRYLKGNVREYVRSMMFRFDADFIKNCLRLWYKKASPSREFLESYTCFKYDTAKLLNSRTVEEFILYLHDTPFIDPLIRKKDLFHEKKSLFPLELALDIWYYENLMEKSGLLSSDDREIIKKTIGLEIDIKNIEGLIRYRHYYNLPMGDAMGFMIPHGHSIKGGMIRDLYSSGSLKGIFGVLAPGAPLPDIRDEKKNLAAIESILTALLKSSARSLLARFPFSISVVIAYFILKRLEIKSVGLILSGRHLDLAPETITGALNV